MDIPELEQSHRIREYKSYTFEEISRLVKHWLLIGDLGHRELEREILEIDPAYFRGFQAMGILHYLGLKQPFKGIFRGFDLPSVISEFKNNHQDFTEIIRHLEYQPMATPSRTLITTTFLDRISRLDDVTRIMVIVNDYLGIPGQQYEQIPGAESDMYSLGCGSNEDKILGEPIQVRVVAYQQGDTRIFCYVGQADLALSWARHHKVQLLDSQGFIRVSELTDTGHAAQAYIERYIEFGEEGLLPSPLVAIIDGLTYGFEPVQYPGSPYGSYF